MREKGEGKKLTKRVKTEDLEVKGIGRMSKRSGYLQIKKYAKFTLQENRVK